MLDPQKVQRVAIDAISMARGYFMIDPSWQISLELKPLYGPAGQVNVKARYRVAEIALDPQMHNSLEIVWESCGHEVAHVVMAWLDLLQGKADNQSYEWEFAEENVVTTLERMWMRDCPYPADKYEPKPKAKGKKRGSK